MAQPATTLDPLEIQNQQLQALQVLVSSMGALNHLAEMSSKLDKLDLVIEENKALKQLLTEQNRKIDEQNRKIDSLQRQCEIANKPVKTKQFTTGFSHKHWVGAASFDEFNSAGATMIKKLQG